MVFKSLSSWVANFCSVSEGRASSGHGACSGHAGGSEGGAGTGHGPGSAVGNRASSVIAAGALLQGTAA